jgi:plasmid maintenance system killer protein
MIKSITDKKIQNALKNNDYSAFNVKNQKKLELVMNILDSATTLKDCDFHGGRLHPHLSSKNKKHKVYSLDVGGKDRILFKFIDGHVYDVTFADPH